MKFPKLHSVVDPTVYTDFPHGLRAGLSFINIQKEFTYATNAHTLVRHKTSELFNEEFYNSLPENGIILNARMIAEICRRDTSKVVLGDGTIEMVKNGYSVLFVLPNRDDYHFPQYESVIPDIKDTKPVNEIAIKPHLLTDLYNAMGLNGEGIVMNLFAPTKAVLIRPNGEGSNYPSVVGILMPIMIRS